MDFSSSQFCDALIVLRLVYPNTMTISTCSWHMSDKTSKTFCFLKIHADIKELYDRIKAESSYSIPPLHVVIISVAICNINWISSHPMNITSSFCIFWSKLYVFDILYCTCQELFEIIVMCVYNRLSTINISQNQPEKKCKILNASCTSGMYGDHHAIDLSLPQDDSSKTKTKLRQIVYCKSKLSHFSELLDLKDLYGYLLYIVLGSEKPFICKCITEVNFTLCFKIN